MALFLPEKDSTQFPQDPKKKKKEKREGEPEEYIYEPLAVPEIPVPDADVEYDFAPLNPAYTTKKTRRTTVVQQKVDQEQLKKVQDARRPMDSRDLNKPEVRQRFSVRDDNKLVTGLLFGPQTENINSRMPKDILDETKISSVDSNTQSAAGYYDIKDLVGTDQFGVPTGKLNEEQLSDFLYTKLYTDLLGNDETAVKTIVQAEKAAARKPIGNPKAAADELERRKQSRRNEVANFKPFEVSPTPTPKQDAQYSVSHRMEHLGLSGGGKVGQLTFGKSDAGSFSFANIQVQNIANSLRAQGYTGELTIPNWIIKKELGVDGTKKISVTKESLARMIQVRDSAKDNKLKRIATQPESRPLPKVENLLEAGYVMKTDDGRLITPVSSDNALHYIMGYKLLSKNGPPTPEQLQAYVDKAKASLPQRLIKREQDNEDLARRMKKGNVSATETFSRTLVDAFSWPANLLRTSSDDRSLYTSDTDFAEFASNLGLGEIVEITDEYGRSMGSKGVLKTDPETARLLRSYYNKLSQPSLDQTSSLNWQLMSNPKFSGSNVAKGLAYSLTYGNPVGLMASGGIRTAAAAVGAKLKDPTEYIEDAIANNGGTDAFFARTVAEMAPAFIPMVGIPYTIAAAVGNTVGMPWEKRLPILATTIGSISLSKFFSKMLRMGAVSGTVNRAGEQIAYGGRELARPIAKVGLAATQFGGGTLSTALNWESFRNQETGEIMWSQVLTNTIQDGAMFLAGDIPEIIRSSNKPIGLGRWFLKDVETGQHWGMVYDFHEQQPRLTRMSEENVMKVKAAAEKSGEQFELSDATTAEVMQIKTLEDNFANNISRALFGNNDHKNLFSQATKNWLAPSEILGGAFFADPRFVRLDGRNIRTFNGSELDAMPGVKLEDDEYAQRKAAVMNSVKSGELNKYGLSGDAKFITTLQRMKAEGSLEIADNGKITLTKQGETEYSAHQDKKAQVMKTLNDDINAIKEEIDGLTPEEILRDVLPSKQSGTEKDGKIQISEKQQAMNAMLMLSKFGTNVFGLYRAARAMSSAAVDLSVDDLVTMSPNNQKAVMHALAAGALKLDGDSIRSVGVTAEIGGKTIDFGASGRGYAERALTEIGEALAKGESAALEIGHFKAAFDPENRTTKEAIKTAAKEKFARHSEEAAKSQEKLTDAEKTESVHRAAIKDDADLFKSLEDPEPEKLTVRDFVTDEEAETLGLEPKPETTAPERPSPVPGTRAGEPTTAAAELVNRPLSAFDWVDAATTDTLPGSFVLKPKKGRTEGFESYTKSSTGQWLDSKGSEVTEKSVIAKVKSGKYDMGIPKARTELAPDAPRAEVVRAETEAPTTPSQKRNAATQDAADALAGEEGIKQVSTALLTKEEYDTNVKSLKEGKGVVHLGNGKSITLTEAPRTTVGGPSPTVTFKPGEVEWHGLAAAGLMTDAGAGRVFMNARAWEFLSHVLDFVDKNTAELGIKKTWTLSTTADFGFVNDRDATLGIVDTIKEASDYALNKYLESRGFRAAEIEQLKKAPDDVLRTYLSRKGFGQEEFKAIGQFKDGLEAYLVSKGFGEAEISAFKAQLDTAKTDLAGHKNGIFVQVNADVLRRHPSGAANKLDYTIRHEAIHKLLLDWGGKDVINELLGSKFGKQLLADADFNELINILSSIEGQDGSLESYSAVAAEAKTNTHQLKVLVHEIVAHGTDETSLFSGLGLNKENDAHLRAFFGSFYTILDAIRQYNPDVYAKIRELSDERILTKSEEYYNAIKSDKFSGGLGGDRESIERGGHSSFDEPSTKTQIILKSADTAHGRSDWQGSGRKQLHPARGIVSSIGSDTPGAEGLSLFAISRPDGVVPIRLPDNPQGAELLSGNPTLLDLTSDVEAQNAIKNMTFGKFVEWAQERGYDGVFGLDMGLGQDNKYVGALFNRATKSDPVPPEVTRQVQEAIDVAKPALDMLESMPLFSGDRDINLVLDKNTLTNNMVALATGQGIYRLSRSESVDLSTDNRWKPNSQADYLIDRYDPSTIYVNKRMVDMLTELELKNQNLMPGVTYGFSYPSAKLYAARTVAALIPELQNNTPFAVKYTRDIIPAFELLTKMSGTTIPDLAKYEAMDYIDQFALAKYEKDSFSINAHWVGMDGLMGYFTNIHETTHKHVNNLVSPNIYLELRYYKGPDNLLNSKNIATVADLMSRFGNSLYRSQADNFTTVVQELMAFGTNAAELDAIGIDVRNNQHVEAYARAYGEVVQFIAKHIGKPSAISVANFTSPGVASVVNKIYGNKLPEIGRARRIGEETPLGPIFSSDRRNGQAAAEIVEIHNRALELSGELRAESAPKTLDGLITSASRIEKTVEGHLLLAPKKIDSLAMPDAIISDSTSVISRIARENAEEFWSSVPKIPGDERVADIDISEYRVLKSEYQKTEHAAEMERLSKAKDLTPLPNIEQYYGQVQKLAGMTQEQIQKTYPQFFRLIHPDYFKSLGHGVSSLMADNLDMATRLELITSEFLNPKGSSEYKYFLSPEAREYVLTNKRLFHDVALAYAGYKVTPEAMGFSTPFTKNTRARYESAPGKFKNKSPMLLMSSDRPSRVDLSSQDGFYSNIESLLHGFDPTSGRPSTKKIPVKAPGKDWANILANSPGIKTSEMLWSGMDAFLKDNASKSLTIDDLKNFMAANKVTTAVSREESATSTRWSQYTLGGPIKSHVETLVTVPAAVVGKTAGNWTENDLPPTSRLASEVQFEGGKWVTKWYVESKMWDEFNNRYMNYMPDDIGKTFYTKEVAIKHFMDQQMRRFSFRNNQHYDLDNIAVHWRGNLRTDANDFTEVLHLEEVQSDWGQRLASVGAATEDSLSRNLAELRTQIDSDRLKLSSLWKPFSSKTKLDDIITTTEFVTVIFPKDVSSGVRQLTAEEAENLVSRVDSDYRPALKNSGLDVDAMLGMLRDNPAKVLEAAIEAKNSADRLKSLIAQENAVRKSILEQRTEPAKPPDMPFRQNWKELAFKNALRYAAENGLGRLTWTTGRQQLERYDSEFKKSVDRIEYKKASPVLEEQIAKLRSEYDESLVVFHELQLEKINKNRELNALLIKRASGEALSVDESKAMVALRAAVSNLEPRIMFAKKDTVNKALAITSVEDLQNRVRVIGYKDGEVVFDQKLNSKGSTSIHDTELTLEGLFGANIAKQIREDTAGDGFFEGENLTIGGEFYKQVYDRDMVNFANKYLGKYGSKVTKTILQAEGDAYHEVWSVDVPTEFSEAALSFGQPMFATTRNEEQIKAIHTNKSGQAGTISDEMMRIYQTRPEDLTLGQFQKVLTTGRFSILSGQKYGMSESEIRAVAAQLNEHLGVYNLFAVPIKGYYGGEEYSFFIYGESPGLNSVAEVLGVFFDQESVVHGIGGQYKLQYLDGTGREQHGTGIDIGTDSGPVAQPDGTLKNGSFANIQGKPLSFNINFGNPVVGKPMDYSLGVDNHLFRKSLGDIGTITEAMRLVRVGRAVDGSLRKIGPNTALLNGVVVGEWVMDDDIGTYILKFDDPEKFEFITKAEAGKKNQVYHALTYRSGNKKGKTLHKSWKQNNEELFAKLVAKYGDNIPVILNLTENVASYGTPTVGESGLKVSRGKALPFPYRFLRRGDGDFGPMMADDAQILLQTALETTSGIVNRRPLKPVPPRERDFKNAPNEFMRAKENYELAMKDYDQRELEWKARANALFARRVELSLDNFFREAGENWEKHNYNMYFYSRVREAMGILGKTMPEFDTEQGQGLTFLVMALLSRKTKLKYNVDNAVNAMQVIFHFMETGKFPFKIPNTQYDIEAMLDSDQFTLKKTDKQFSNNSSEMDKLKMFLNGYVTANSTEGQAILKANKGMKVTYANDILPDAVESVDSPNRTQYVKSDVLMEKIDRSGALNGVLHYLLEPSLNNEPRAKDLLGLKIGTFFSNMFGIETMATIDSWMTLYHRVTTGGAYSVDFSDPDPSKHYAVVFNKEPSDEEYRWINGQLQEITSQYNRKTGKNLTVAQVQSVLWGEIMSALGPMTRRGRAKRLEMDDGGDVLSMVQRKLAQEKNITTSPSEKTLQNLNDSPELRKIKAQQESIGRMSDVVGTLDRKGEQMVLMMSSDRTAELQAQNQVMNLSEQGLKDGDPDVWEDTARRMVKHGALADSEVQAIKALAEKGDVDGLRTYVLSLNKQHPLELVVNAGRVALLLGLRNISKNVVGNSLRQFMDEVGRVPASVLDIAMIAFNKSIGGTNFDRSTTSILTNPVQTLDSYRRALGKGVVQGGKEFIEVLRGKDEGIMFEHPSLFRERTTGWKFLKPLEIFEKYGWRLQGAMDRPFNVAAFYRTLSELQYMRQKIEVDRGNDITFSQAEDYLTIADFQLAEEYALHATYQKDNPIANRYYQMVDGLPPTWRAIITNVTKFVKTPLNVVDYILDYSGFWPITKLAIREYNTKDWVSWKDSAKKIMDNPQDRKVLSMAISQGAIGSLMLHVGYKLAMAGLLSGFFDREEKKEEEQMEAKGTSFGKIQVGDTSIDISWLAPNAFYLIAGATMYGSEKNYETKLAELEQELSIAQEEQDQVKVDRLTMEIQNHKKTSPGEESFSRILKNLALQTPFLRQLDDIKTVYDQNRLASGLLEKWVSPEAYVPAIAKEIAGAKDAYERVVTSESMVGKMAERVQKNIPTLPGVSSLGAAMEKTGLPLVSGIGKMLTGREALPVKYDMFGNPVQGVGGLNPFKPTKVSKDELVRELDRFNISITKPEGLTAAQVNELRREKGQYFEPFLRAVVTSENYSTLSDIDKKKTLEASVRFITNNMKKRGAERLSDEDVNFNVSMLPAREAFKTTVKENPESILKPMTITDKRVLLAFNGANLPARIGVKEILEDIRKTSDLARFVNDKFQYEMMVSDKTRRGEAEANFAEFQKDPTGVLIRWWAQDKRFKESSDRTNARRAELAREGKSTAEIETIIRKEASKRGAATRRKLKSFTKVEVTR